MTDKLQTYRTPALGCMIGKAYQTLLIQLSSALRKAGLDITTTEYLVLRALYSNDGIQQCEIAEMTGKDKSAVCRCVAALQQKGFIRTETISHKCLRVYLTDEGRAIEQAVMTVAVERHRALTDKVTEDELEIFSKVLERIISQ